MHPQHSLSFWIIGRLDLIVQVATLVVAVIAARRHAIRGLWILVLALLLTVALSITDLVFFLMIQAGHDAGMSYLEALGHVPLIIMVITLCGWCILAFCRKKGDKPDA